MAPPNARHLNQQNQRLTRLPSGQLVLRKGFISISRRAPFVAFALAQKPIGLDLELVRRDDDLIDAPGRQMQPIDSSREKLLRTKWLSEHSSQASC